MKKEELKEKSRVEFITHFTDRYTYLDSVRIALEGGCRWIQLRMKETTPEDMMPIAKEAMAMCHKYGATFIIDDHVKLVKQIGADGVHLGKKDMPVTQARQILGKEFIIGGTANTIDDVRRLSAEGADYIGCGPFRFTTTKKKLAPVLGLEGYQEIVWKCREQGINIPIVAIGGITKDDVRKVLHSGPNGVAISGGILSADDPKTETEEILKTIEKCF